MTHPAPWDHASQCAAVTVSYAEAMGWEPLHWGSLQACDALRAVNGDTLERDEEEE